jgi:deoxyribonuclease V
MPASFPTHLTPKQAIALQGELASGVVQRPLPAPRKGLLVAGADCSYEKRATLGYAAIVVCRWPGLEVVEIGRAEGAVGFPYVPGLLSFREMPLLERAWGALGTKPELVVMDGQGIAHPRGLGIAAHAGLHLGVPTIGCAKSILVGEHRRLGSKRGSRAALVYRDRKIGTALRTREGVQPLYISPGHLCDFETSCRWILRLAQRYRQPEVIRLAHSEVNRMRREAALECKA